MFDGMRFLLHDLPPDLFQNANQPEGVLGYVVGPDGRKINVEWPAGTVVSMGRDRQVVQSYRDGYDFDEPGTPLLLEDA